jgi:hypothetical protein
MAITYLLMNKVDLGCQSYDASLEDFRENMRRHPDAKPALPKGFTNFEDAIRYGKSKAGCK